MDLLYQGKSGEAAAELQEFAKKARSDRGKGDKDKAKELCKRAAEFNSLPNVNFAFVRTKAKAAV